MIKYDVRLIALIALLSIPASLHACWSHVPLENTVADADYVLHLKVVEILEQDGDAEEYDSDGKTLKRFPSDYAVCEIREVVMGLVVTDNKGHVSITSAAQRNTNGLSTDVSYKIGDELTLVASEVSIVKTRGMVFYGGGHPNRRQNEAPSKKLRKLIQERMDTAYALLDKFDRLIPGAKAEAKKAIIEHENRLRTDFKNVSPEADLLLDLMAINRGAPAEAKAERPTLDASTRERLGVIALQVIFDLSKSSARMAVKLLGDEGHGAHAMIAPADISKESAARILQQLNKECHLNAIFSHLVKFDSNERVMNWTTTLVLQGGAAGKFGEWLWIEHFSDEYAVLTRLIKAETEGGYEYDSDEKCALARLIDAKAWALCAVFQHKTDTVFSDSDQPEGENETHQKRVRALGELHKQAGYLAAYAYLKSTKKGELGLVDMKNKIKEARSDFKKDSLDLDDFESIEECLNTEYTEVPGVLLSAIRKQQ